EHAWSGEANELDKPLSELKDEPFNVTVTEKVDETTWYGGSVEGIDEVIWVEAKFVTTEEPESDSTEEAADDQDAAKEEATTDESKDDEAVTESEETEQDSDEQADEANANEEESADDKEDAEKDQVTEENELDDEDKEAQDQADEDKQAIEEQEAEEDASDDEDQAANESKEERATKVAPRIALFSQSRAAAKPVESKTSRLGHIRGGTHYIYKTLGNESTKFSSAPYHNAVYYIKKQATYNGKTYYLIRSSLSSSAGIIGWMESKDLVTYEHKAVDSKKKTLYFKGKGVAYDRAWGDKKNLVFNSLKSYKDQAFNVHLTESVGSNIWYRGDFKGERIWVHSDHLSKAQQSAASTQATSRLGQIKNSKVLIYSSLSGGSSKVAGSEFTNRVFYIKRQGTKSGSTYYLLSTSPSSTKGLVGWVKSSDLTSYTHKSVTSKKKTLFFKGKGVAYNRAWGGSKNRVYSSLKSMKGKEFKVNLTEKVGENTWYRSTYNNKTLWIHTSHLANKYTTSESSTSKLGKLNINSVKLYSEPGYQSTAKAAGTTNAGQVFYIKKQAKTMKGETYYQIRNSLSS